MAAAAAAAEAATALAAVAPVIAKATHMAASCVPLLCNTTIRALLWTSFVICSLLVEIKSWMPPLASANPTLVCCVCTSWGMPCLSGLGCCSQSFEASILVIPAEASKITHCLGWGIPCRSGGAAWLPTFCLPALRLP